MRLPFAARFILAAVPALSAALPALADTAATERADPQGLPAPVRAMVETAARSGDSARTDAVVLVAKQTNPRFAAEIDRLVAGIRAEQAAAREAKIREASFLDNWKGSGQLGGAISTGNADTRSVTAGLKIQRDGLAWRHRADLLVDIVDNRRGNDQERILAGYQVDYKFSDRLYSWGRLEYERNREAGIARRFAQSAGAGWRAVDGAKFRWDLETGPALRQTRFFDYSENSIAVRSASRLLWNLSASTAFSNDTALFWDTDGSISNSAALTSRLFGAFSARLSYNLAWEEAPPEGRVQLDTTSRATLVYEF